MSEQNPGQTSTGPGAAPAADPPWERKVLTDLAREALAEQRRARRWGVFFKFLFFVYLVALLVLYRPSLWDSGDGDGAHTALVDLDGVIAPGSDASADRIVQGLRAAFEDENTKGVILRINSPGGSPVQSAYINDEITRLRGKHPDIPLYAVIADVCASGGYYVAAAADRIYANESSLVGSIGVLMNGFGFVGLMDRVGVERRLHTAGASKGFLDPFSPEKPGDVAHIQGILEGLHEQFISVVRRGRGDRLKGGEELWSGLVWSGSEGLELGLVDALGSAGHVARDVVGVERIVNFTPAKGLLERVSDRLGMRLGHALTDALGLNVASPR